MVVCPHRQVLQLTARLEVWNSMIHCVTCSAGPPSLRAMTLKAWQSLHGIASGASLVIPMLFSMCLLRLSSCVGVDVINSEAFVPGVYQ